MHEPLHTSIWLPITVGHTQVFDTGKNDRHGDAIETCQVS